jgi:prepilin-type processing-associated H-X9-DG protein
MVTIAIIGLLLAILVPAVSAARESSRRTKCRSNLHQIGLALHAHEAAHRKFPEVDFTFGLLPYLERRDIYELWPDPFPRDLTIDEENALLAKIGQHQIPLYLCPSDSAPHGPVGRTNYVGNVGSGVQTYGFNGFFSLDRDVAFRASDIRRGLSQTAAVSETLGAYPGEFPRLRTTWNLPRLLACPDELDEFADVCERLPRDPVDFGYWGIEGHGIPWHAKFVMPEVTYNHILPPNRPHCMNRDQGLWACQPAKSAHSGGAMLMYADGHVALISESIDRKLWREIGSRIALADAVPVPAGVCSSP